MKYQFISIPTALVVLFFAFAKAGYSQESAIQESLTLEQAMALALENNFSIQIERKQSEIAEEQYSIGNAGLLPSIHLIGSGNYTNNQTDLTIRTFQPPPAPATQSFDESGVAALTAQGVVQADYTVFAGFSGRYRYKILESANQIAHYQQQVTINQTLVQVSTLFLEIAKLQRREELLKQNIEITSDRIQRIQDQKQFGKATGLDVLNAESNLNRDKTLLDQVLLTKNNLIRDLNFVIGYQPEQQYRVSVMYAPQGLQDIPSIQQEILKNNPQLLLAEQGIVTSDYEIGLAKSRTMPQLDVFANYGAFYQENDLQQLAEITNIGYTVGATLRFNIFDGSQTRTAIRSAELQKESIEIEKEQLQSRLLTDAVTEVNRIQILETQLERERVNLITFQEAFTRTEERFKNGKATNLDIRDAQTALLDAEIIIAELQADIMNAYLRLDRLKGKI
ncbi:TolC family protein [Aquimarina sp. U1-2]|uniref:TolC family protein n=1 Tax=Aquimarina sp. U1-2 TaxID=2823141 RepID=UPI001AECAD89|nr:TolC family protein [Aquimarina sp. U1-2]MBP2831088.1 TolC family protein [Aquimarina sp. U1-2]